MRNGSTVGLSQSSGAGLLRKSSLSGMPRLRSIFLELGSDIVYKLQAELISVNRGLKVIEEEKHTRRGRQQQKRILERPRVSYVPF